MTTVRVPHPRDWRLPAAAEDRRAGRPTTADAFGKAVADCWQSGAVPGRTFEVMEMDDGDVRVGDVASFYFPDPAEVPELERQVCVRATGRVLDAACRAGSRAVWPADQEKVRSVTGIEFSPGAVELARTRGVDAHLGSVHELPDGIGPFDTFVLAGEGQGVIGNAELAPGALRNLAALAAPGATLLYQGLDPYQAFGGFLGARTGRNRAAGRLPGTLRIRSRYQQLSTPWFDYLYCSADEFTALAEGTGWLRRGVETDGTLYLVTLQLAARTRDRSGG
ncbi:class I SAM-dependent methyltransferase [Streptomyces iconiensis]|uniref:Class I SAM-dependent methyltransferase n=1 Tax=Streptomyces iconiensis TaxID=1384038 RepID=A0ABT6ZPQ8_9ACTN|nr:class I SAM-dependent methyltransferase [Streptomyces iconiensis]MDJ1131024.1 class I SAM-dependent methyltransferase [Streptomyces iconiensis]